MVEHLCEGIDLLEKSPHIPYLKESIEKLEQETLKKCTNVFVDHLEHAFFIMFRRTSITKQKLQALGAVETTKEISDRLERFERHAKAARLFIQRKEPLRSAFRSVLAGNVSLNWQTYVTGPDGTRLPCDRVSSLDWIDRASLPDGDARSPSVPTTISVTIFIHAKMIKCLSLYDVLYFEKLNRLAAQCLMHLRGAGYPRALRSLASDNL